MKKINILLFLFFIYINSFSSDFCIALKFAGNFSKNMIFSRDFSIENYHNCTKCPFKCSFLFSQESFDNFFWGTTNRLSLKYNLLFGEKENLFLKIGPGISFATSYGASSFSPDIYIKLYYWKIFAFLDTSFYSDGLFNENGIGIEFKIWEIVFDTGFNNIFISDYKNNFIKMRFMLGCGYEF